MKRSLMSNSGLTLVELMVVMGLLAAAFLSSTPLFNQLLAAWQVEAVSQAFMHSAQRARALSLNEEKPVFMRPRESNDWSAGWNIWIGQEIVFTQIPDPQVVVAWELLKPQQGFREKALRSSQSVSQLSFERGYFGQLSSGGFLANRLIWRSQLYPAIQRHVILGPGGRWRLCNPKHMTCSDS